MATWRAVNRLLRGVDAHARDSARRHRARAARAHARGGISNGKRAMQRRRGALAHRTRYNIAARCVKHQAYRRRRARAARGARRSCGNGNVSAQSTTAWRARSLCAYRACICARTRLNMARAAQRKRKAAGSGIESVNDVKKEISEIVSEVAKKKRKWRYHHHRQRRIAAASAAAQ